jgi:hypothetical protein
MIQGKAPAVKLKGAMGAGQALKTTRRKIIIILQYLAAFTRVPWLDIPSRRLPVTVTFDINE